MAHELGFGHVTAIYDWSNRPRAAVLIGFDFILYTQRVKIPRECPRPSKKCGCIILEVQPTLVRIFRKSLVALHLMIVSPGASIHIFFLLICSLISCDRSSYLVFQSFSRLWPLPPRLHICVLFLPIFNRSARGDDEKIMTIGIPLR